MATPFFSIPSSRPDPDPTPKPRGRKNGGKSQNGTKDKTRRRGVGIAELERLRHLDEQSPPTTPPCSSTITNPITDSRVNPFHHSNPLSGVPLIRYCLPGQPIHDQRITHRVDPSPSSPSPSSSSLLSELPSMPNPFHSTLSFKKKRVTGEDAVGFTKGYDGHFDIGGFSAHHPITTHGSEVVAIHRKWNGSGNVMMEYGFFPGKSEENNGEEEQQQQQQNMMKIDYYNNNSSSSKQDLNLNMGFSDSSMLLLSSPSSSSSLSSLTTSTTTNCNTPSVDLSLKLSSY